MKFSDSSKAWRAGSYGFGETTARRIALGIDSLTDGSGGSTYRSTLMTRLRASYGDAGLGISYAADTCDGAVLVDSNTGTAIDGISSWADARRTKSFFGRGTYWNNAAAGTCNIRDAAGNATRYESVTVWVEFTAAGQTVKLKPYFGAGTKEVTYTSDNFALNTPIPLHFPLSIENFSGTDYVGFQVTVNTNGANDLFFWAKEFHLTTPIAGMQFTNLGIGGVKISDWIGLDATRFAFWMGVLRPHGFIANGGMNDRGSGLNNANIYIDKIPATAPVYRNLETLLGRIQSGWPKVRGLLVCPNDTSDRATTIIGQYPAMMKALAADLGWSFVDDQALLGLNAAAVSAGYMTGGDVHPTSTGNARRGNAYADIFATV